MDKAEKNREGQRTWYAKQKHPYGRVYCLVFDDGDIYVGSTTNSLKKRREQHKSHSKQRLGTYSPVQEKIRGGIDFVIGELYECGEGDDLREMEQFYIQELDPHLNKTNAIKQVIETCVRGIQYKGVFYKTYRDLWEREGKVKYNTFKTRKYRLENDSKFRNKILKGIQDLSSEEYIDHILYRLLS